jgi:hypothetical protein
MEMRQCSRDWSDATTTGDKKSKNVGITLQVGKARYTFTQKSSRKKTILPP